MLRTARRKNLNLALGPLLTLVLVVTWLYIPKFQTLEIAQNILSLMLIVIATALGGALSGALSAALIAVFWTYHYSQAPQFSWFAWAILLIGATSITAIVSRLKQRADRSIIEHRARIMAEKAHEKTTFLSLASKSLDSTLDLQQTIESITRLAVPYLADWCAVDILQDGHVGREAVSQLVSNDGENLKRLAHIVDATVINTQADHPIAQVVRQLKPYVRQDHMILPLIARGKCLGSITFIRAESGKAFSGMDFATAQELASRAALASDNSRLYGEAQRARAELTQAEARLRTVITNAPLILFAIDRNGICTLSQGKALSGIGYKPGELEGHSMRDLFKDLPEILGNLQRALDGEAFRVFSELNGSSLETQFSPLYDSSGHLTGTIGLSIDVTETKRIERERTEALFRERRARADAEAAHKRTAFLAEATTLLASSLDYFTTLQRAADLVVPYLADGCAVDIVGESGHCKRVAFSSVDGTGGSLPIPDLAVSSKVILSGSPEFASGEHASYMIVPMKVRDRILGSITFLAVGSGRRYDATDVALAEDLANRAALAIENASLYQDSQAGIDTRNVFLSIASHELKTPLTALQLQIQVMQTLLKTGQRSDTLISLLDQAEGQCKTITHLINELLDVSRITSGGLDLKQERLDLSMTVKEVITRLNQEISLSGCTFTLHANVPVWGAWDKMRVEQIATNLISNAIKYGNSQPIDVSVESDTAGGKARLIVRDHGIGIRPEDQDRIFERFQRATSNRRFKGLGLGLFITKQIVQAHGGQIYVESRLGKGSTFTVELPLEQEHLGLQETA